MAAVVALEAGAEAQALHLTLSLLASAEQLVKQDLVALKQVVQETPVLTMVPVVDVLLPVLTIPLPLAVVEVGAKEVLTLTVMRSPQAVQLSQVILLLVLMMVRSVVMELYYRLGHSYRKPTHQAEQSH